MIENPDYTFREFCKDAGYDCSHELEAIADYKENVMVCHQCEQTAEYFVEIGEETHLYCKECHQSENIDSSVHFDN